jgi:hypothetical protein
MLKEITKPPSFGLKEKVIFLSLKNNCEILSGVISQNRTENNKGNW